jgi:SAM-dependent methyltransferase
MTNATSREITLRTITAPLFDRVKTHTPWAIRHLTRRIRREFQWVRNSRLSVRDVFHQVYAKNAWGGEAGAFYSGPGSEDLPATTYAEGIRRFVARHGIRSVVDLGCGDFRVAEMLLDDGIDYTGVDVVETLIRENRERFGRPSVRFECLDITSDPLPPGDLCLIREVLQHLSNAEILQILPKLSQYRYAIYSDYQPASVCIPNRDIPHGHDTRIWRDSALLLDQPPFNRTIELLFEAPASTTLRGPGEQIRTFLIR